MPRVTKAQLEQQVERLEKENQQLKRRISRGHDRSRSPRMPATSSQINMEMTCRAMNQVRFWQQDTVNQEHRNEIERLKEQVAVQADEIAMLRRGEGPVGPVLQHIHELQFTRYGIQPTEADLNLFLEQNVRQTRPVHEILESMYWAAMDLAEVARYGGSLAPRLLPLLQ